jgi:hypothetical protein
MKPRNMWLWAIIAAGLFAFIFLYERRARDADTGAALVVPGVEPAAVSLVQVRPAGQLEIRAKRAADSWRLIEPLDYPAQAASIEHLLSELEQLTPATIISANEMNQRPRANEEFGFESPQASLILQQEGLRHHLLIGARTAPGDQVFVQVVGREAVYVVDAGLLEFVPRSPNDWRDTAFVDFADLVFDRIVATNKGKTLELKRDSPDKLWRILPLQDRADSTRIDAALLVLQSLRVQQFVSDSTTADLEAFGLQPAELAIAFHHGPELAMLLQFGKTATNDPGLVYARRDDQNTIVAVPTEWLSPWRGSQDFFRDRHLVGPARAVDEIEIRGTESFTLQRTTNNQWRVLPQNFPADPALVNGLLTDLRDLRVVQFVKDVVTEPDLPTYGLAAPSMQVILRKAVPGTNGPAYSPVASLDFGATQDGKVFARRPDETFVYAVALADFERIPASGWQARARRIWNFSVNDVARVTIHQGGRARALVRNGTNSWSFAPGSQGIINDFAVEEAVHRLGELAAFNWVHVGEQHRGECGLGENSHRVLVELKNGEKLSVDFGGEAPSGMVYASVMLNGEPWIFECPLPLYQFVEAYLTIPANIP